MDPQGTRGGPWSWCNTPFPSSSSRAATSVPHRLRPALPTRHERFQGAPDAAPDAWQLA
jgi:hypothetical protein